MAGTRRLSMCGSQSRPVLADTRLAVNRLPLVGRLPENVPDRGRVPSGPAASFRDALFAESVANLRYRIVIYAIPLEQRYDDSLFRWNDLEARHSVTCAFTDVAISVGRLAEDADGPTPRGVRLPATTPLQNLGPFVLGDHTLDL